MQTHPDRGSFGIGLRVLARAPMRTKLMVAFMCLFIILDFFLEARHWTGVMRTAVSGSAE